MRMFVNVLMLIYLLELALFVILLPQMGLFLGAGSIMACVMVLLVVFTFGDDVK